MTDDILREYFTLFNTFDETMNLKFLELKYCKLSIGDDNIMY